MERRRSKRALSYCTVHSLDTEGRPHTTNTLDSVYVCDTHTWNTTVEGTHNVQFSLHDSRHTHADDKRARNKEAETENALKCI